MESTTLATIAYDGAGQLLQLEFRSGAVYQYFGVPATVHQELWRANSKGRHFNRAIRGSYPYRLVRNGNAEAPDTEWRR